MTDVLEKINKFATGPCYIYGTPATNYSLGTLLDVPFSPEARTEFDALEETNSELRALADAVRDAEGAIDDFVATEEFNVQTQLVVLGLDLAHRVALVQLALGIAEWLEERRDEES